MAALAPAGAERRSARRVLPSGMGYQQDALLRPGQSVVLVNISPGGALVESAGRLRPGALTELQVWNACRRRSVRGRIARCRVVGLDPVRYEGAIVFEGHLDAGESPAIACGGGEQSAPGADSAYAIGGHGVPAQ